MTIPLYFYWDRKFIRFEINAQSLKYITYALFLIFSEFLLVSLGFVKIDNIDLNFDKFLILALINSFLLAPILEEIFFRSHIIYGIEKFTACKSKAEFQLVLISNVVWSAGHIDESAYFYIHTFVFGMVLSYLRLRTSSLITCIVLHMAANILGAAAVFFQG